jgi:aminoglycoside 3-N-acetyltransferase I
MPPFEIQRLGAQDTPRMGELNAMFGQAFGEPETYGAEPPGRDWLESVLAKAHVIALAALADGAVAGGLVAYELDKLERARREVYLYDLAVAEPFRRQGIATALIRRLQEIAAARGAWVVFVQADYQDAPAVALYEKLGVREEVLHYDLKPPG